MNGRDRLSLWVSAAAIGLGVLMAGCGGAGDRAAAEAETIRSSDGILAVVVPAGAAGDGVQVEVAQIAEADLPPSLRAADSATFGYELSPDGAEFAEPLTLEFRIDPAQLGIDLPEGAVPFGLLLTENAAGELESVADAVLGREDGMVVARGHLSHFSPAYLHISNREVIGLRPQVVDLTVGEAVHVEVAWGTVESGLSHTGGLELDFPTVEWSAIPPFAIADRLGGMDLITGPDIVKSVSCNAPTSGVLEGAFSVHLEPTSEGLEVAIENAFDEFHFLGNPTLAQSFDLAGDGSCKGGSTAGSSSSTTTTTEALPYGMGPPGVDPPDDWKEGSFGPATYHSGAFNIVGLSFDPTNGYFDITFDEDSEGFDPGDGWVHVEVTFIQEIDNRMAMIYRDTGGGPDWYMVGSFGNEPPANAVLQVVWLQANVLRFIIEGIDVTNIAGWEAFSLVRTGNDDTYEDATARQPGG